MKVLKDYCHQSPYASARGECIIQIEPGDDVDKIIAVYTKERPWFDQEYRNPRRTDKWYPYKGDLLVFDTYREYCD